MKYIEAVNNQIKKTVMESQNIILFGQNINAGSCLGGLTRGIKVSENSKIINSTNSENTLCGFGFGLMLNEISSIFFMKQLDFLLLGIDHLVNTFNIIRNTMPNLKSSFTIMPIIMDNGYQGPQSSLNNFSDFCSIARISGYVISTKYEAEKIISSKLVSPGFRILGVSQRLFGKEILEIEPIDKNEDLSLIQYTRGKDVTIVCFNFSFPLGWKLLEELKNKKIDSSIFNVTKLTPINWEKIIDDVKITKKIIIMDDSKSENLLCYNLISIIHDQCKLDKKIVVKKNISSYWLDPVDDQMDINYKKIIDEIQGN